MRTLLALTALMLLLATAVWWKTKPTTETSTLPPTSQEDPYKAVVTLGTRGEANLAEASFPKANTQSDGGADHESPVISPPSIPHGVMEVTSTPPDQPTHDPIIQVPTGKTYTIQSGDTLYRILVRAYGSAPESLVTTIAEANALTDPAALTVGANLLLPIVSGFQPPQQP
ncbi:MAG: LysM domain-containing protein [Planctomycetota bacterium]